MPLTPGTRLGVYEVTAQIGEGGMGAVYRGTDTTLSRPVAIKILPDAFASDPERLARFEREAKTLASLNHPNIAAIYGFEKSAGTHALVMELVEGDDLSQRIARGAIPIDEALPIATQIAEALDAAHEQGIIHRDLKPANIKVRADGTVKVLDFGLAKTLEAAGGSSAASQSPTITMPAMTQAGVILGTAAYMSPEQAKGRPADRRSDVWAFGCVLYEMLTGKRCFEGEDVADSLAFVLTKEPDWEALPRDVPPPVRTLVQSCLVKDRRKRVAEISTALFVFDTLAHLVPPGGPQLAALPPSGSHPRHIAALVVAAIIVAVAAGVIVWVAARSSVPPARTSRLSLPLSSGELTVSGNDRDLAITPDGSRLVYVGNGGTQLFVRSLDALDPVALYTGGPRAPFVSPDGRWIGFLEGAVVKKVAITGGPAISLATLDTTARGGAWGPDDTLIVATTSPATGLLAIPAAGGAPVVLTRPDAAKGEADHVWPELLPDGHSVLFTIVPVAGDLELPQVAVLDLRTGAQKVLVRGGSHAQYLSSGYLVYAAAGTLMAASFDLGSLALRRTPVPAVSDVAPLALGGVNAVLARDGTLAYVSGAGVARTLVWVDRQGRETPIPVPARPYQYPRLSPDGTRVALHIGDQERDIWVWDLAREALARFTFGAAEEFYTVWTPDGRRLIFNSTRAGARNVYRQNADGTGTVERLTTSANNQFPYSLSPDGTRLVLMETTPETRNDLAVVFLGEQSRTVPLLATPFGEANGEISPDGRWLAYQSDESGRNEIWVRPFPDVDNGRWQVSTAGGTRPLWARNGRELFYVSPDGAVMGVDVRPAASWSATTPTVAVKEGFVAGSNSIPGRNYDIAPDGARFLMIKEGGGANQTVLPANITVVLNWNQELKRLVPGN